MIPVTKPFLPPIEEYQSLIQSIWKRNWLTNNGPLVNELEVKLIKHLGLKYILYTTNGTIAIQIALKALNITKKVITTPFSYVATTSSLVWEGCTPVYVDIDPDTFNIDVTKIETAIDKDTEAILATHCFGNPCNIDAIDKIAKKHNLKVIYDAAHCFGTSYKGKSVFDYGDVSTASFHATKIFHTIEGGALITQDAALLKKMELMRNFGHAGPENFNGVGINGKNSEFHAAMGILNLKYLDGILEKRKVQSKNYDTLLEGLKIRKQKITRQSEFNFAYYPIVFETEKIALKMKAELEKRRIIPRRYFYPSLNQLDYTNKINMPISDNIASKILCLPLYHALSGMEQEKIANILISVQNN